MTPASVGQTTRRTPWKTSSVIAGGIIFCVALGLAGARWPQLVTIPGFAQYLNPAGNEAPVHYPYVELMKLATAALLGLIVTSVHRHTRHERPLTSSLEHAQILLCISGAIIMIIIGNSLARAFGIAGGASIVRFRTPVEDPKDAMVLFLLLAVGMACGLAAFGVAVLASIFLCVVLVILDRMAEQRAREMTLELVSSGSVFPVQHVQDVFARNALKFEQREVTQGENMTIRYYIQLDPGVSLEALSAQLMETDPPSLQSVSWVKPKKAS